MTDGLSALIIAVVGVAGTLIAPALSQRLALRSQKDQFERQQMIANEQQKDERRQAELTLRRTCYIATNAAARRYRIQMMTYLHRVRRGDADDDVRQELEAARAGHHACFAEAQMIASPAVLRELDTVARELGRGYRRIKYLEEGTPEPEGSFEEIEADLKRLWEQWKLARTEMRRDLRVENDGPPSSP